MAKELSNLRLGDLLTAAGLLKIEELQEAAYIAKNQSLPVGRVLIMSGYLSEALLRSAIKVQSLVKDDVLSLALAQKTLALLAIEPMELETALQKVGWVRPSNMRTNKLGELLSAAGIVNKMQLDLALAQSEHSGLPLGRALVNFGLISEELLASALSAQIFIRDKRITREQAVTALIAAKERAVSLEQTLSESGTIQLPSKPSVRLGQLLVIAGLLEESMLMHAVEIGLVEEQPLGKTLLSLGLIAEPTLVKALEAQALVATGVDVDQAANILTTAVNKNITIAHASSLLMGAQKANKAEADGKSLSLYQFLQLSGLLSAKDLERAIRVGTQDPQIMGTILQKAHILEDYVIEAAIACNDLINKRVLRPDQAIMALNHCQRTRSSIYDCFDEFGWSQPSEKPKPEAEIEQLVQSDNPAAPPLIQRKASSTSFFSKLNRKAPVDPAQSGNQGSVDLNEAVEQSNENAAIETNDENKPKKKLIDLIP